MPQHKAEQQRESPKASGTGATGSHLEAQAAKNSKGLGVSGGHRLSKPKRFTVERFVLLGENMKYNTYQISIAGAHGMLKFFEFLAVDHMAAVADVKAT